MKKPRELSTTARIEQHGGGKEALLKTWERMPAILSEGRRVLQELSTAIGPNTSKFSLTA